jgi:hypothetical protein
VLGLPFLGDGGVDDFPQNLGDAVRAPLLDAGAGMAVTSEPVELTGSSTRSAMMVISRSAAAP